VVVARNISAGGGFGSTVAQDIAYFVLSNLLFMLPREDLEEFRTYCQSSYERWLRQTARKGTVPASSTPTPSGTTLPPTGTTSTPVSEQIPSTSTEQQQNFGVSEPLWCDDDYDENSHSRGWDSSESDDDGDPPASGLVSTGFFFFIFFLFLFFFFFFIFILYFYFFFIFYFYFYSFFIFYFSFIFFFLFFIFYFFSLFLNMR
jgi:hypothetical protein